MVDGSYKHGLSTRRPLFISRVRPKVNLVTWLYGPYTSMQSISRRYFNPFSFPGCQILTLCHAPWHVMSMPNAAFYVFMRPTRFSTNSSVNPSVAIFDAESNFCSITSEKVRIWWEGREVDGSNKTWLSSRRSQFVSLVKPKVSVILIWCYAIYVRSSCSDVTYFYPLFPKPNQAVLSPNCHWSTTQAVITIF